MILERLPGNVYRLNGPAVFHCGCGDTAVRARRKLHSAGCDAPLIQTTGNTATKRYIKQEGLDSKLSFLKQSKHAVLYNPLNGKYIDLLKAPDTDQVNKNIYEVINNG